MTLTLQVKCGQDGCIEESIVDEVLKDKALQLIQVNSDYNPVGYDKDLNMINKYVELHTYILNPQQEP